MTTCTHCIPTCAELKDCNETICDIHNIIGVIVHILIILPVIYLIYYAITTHKDTSIVNIKRYIPFAILVYCIIKIVKYTSLMLGAPNHSIFFKILDDFLLYSGVAVLFLLFGFFIIFWQQLCVKRGTNPHYIQTKIASLIIIICIFALVVCLPEAIMQVYIPSIAYWFEFVGCASFVILEVLIIYFGIQSLLSIQSIDFQQNKMHKKRIFIKLATTVIVTAIIWIIADVYVAIEIIMVLTKYNHSFTYIEIANVISDLLQIIIVLWTLYTISPKKIKDMESSSKTTTTTRTSSLLILQVKMSSSRENVPLP
jgi:hypothetical protein